MPSLAEVTRGRHAPERRRRLAGFGLLLVGAVLVGLGAAGTVSADSTKAGLLVGGFAVLAGLFGLAAVAPLGERERALAGAGAAVGAASLLALWALAPSAVLSRPVLILAAGFSYAAGLTVLLAAVLAGVTLDRGAPGREPSSTSGWTRQTPGPPTGPAAADGGEAGDELDFPLDEE